MSSSMILICPIGNILHSEALIAHLPPVRSSSAFSRVSSFSLFFSWIFGFVDFLNLLSTSFRFTWSLTAWSGVIIPLTVLTSKDRRGPNFRKSCILVFCYHLFCKVSHLYYFLLNWLFYLTDLLETNLQSIVFVFELLVFADFSNTRTA